MSGRYPYQKLARKLKFRILRGYYKPGAFLPAIRTLAEQEGYNPATVRRSLETLKQEGLVVCKGTLGFWINDNCSYIERERIKEISVFHNQLYTNLSSLGFSKQEILVMLQVYEWMKRFAKIASHSAKMERPVVLGKCK